MHLGLGPWLFDGVNNNVDFLKSQEKTLGRFLSAKVTALISRTNLTEIYPCFLQDPCQFQTTSRFNTLSPQIGILTLDEKYPNPHSFFALVVPCVAVTFFLSAGALLQCRLMLASAKLLSSPFPRFKRIPENAALSLAQEAMLFFALRR